MSQNDDLISRQAVYMVIEEVLYETTKGADNWYGLLNNGVRTLPAAQPERKKGRWKGYNTDKEGWTRTDGSPVFMSCSKCNGTVLNNGSAHWNFCPNCGADMRGE